VARTNTGLPLEQGEKVVWQSRGGGPAGWGAWVYVVAALVGLHLCGTLAFVPILILGASTSSSYDSYGEPYDDRPEMSTSDYLAASLPSLLCTLISFGFVGAAGYVAIKPRLRPSYFLTPRALVTTKLLGGYERWPLDRIREMRQYVAVYHGRYGQRQEVPTHRVELQLDSGAWVKVGPIAEMQGLLDLYEHAVATRWIDLASLPEIGGELAPGEARSDVLFVARTRTTAMNYGPLFVGPTRVIRFTEVPEAHQLARLYTLLAREGDAAESEELVVSTARGGSFGHFVDAAREDARPSVDGTTITLRLGERSEPVEVSSADADRARAFFASRR
jgi:hypothetical protein